MRGGAVRRDGLPVIGFHEREQSVHQHFHLPRHFKIIEGKTRDHEIRGEDLLLHRGNVVAADDAFPLRPTPAGKAARARQDAQGTDVDGLDRIVSPVLHSFDKGIRRE